jgi:DNA-binding CsgD family transcriptional regulator
VKLSSPEFSQKKLDLVTDLLLNVTDRQKDIVQLRTAGLSYTEIGEYLSITRQAAWQTGTKAFKKLQEVSDLLDEDFDIHIWPTYIPAPRPVGRPPRKREPVLQPQRTQAEKDSLCKKALEFKALGLSHKKIAIQLDISVSMVQELLMSHKQREINHSASSGRKPE